jgi:transcription elongation factor GreA
MPAATVIAIGSRVTVADTKRNREQTFCLVDGAGDPLHGVISSQSPVGRAVTGHRVGDVVAVSVPSGERELRIVALA